jgi:hypothetical protein
MVSLIIAAETLDRQPGDAMAAADLTQ